MTAPTICNGVAALAERYDGFLLDQWGVLHDGVRPYPGALDCLERLMAAGKRAVIVSNSGKRAAPNAARLAEIGIPSTAYTAIVSSGETAWRLLAERRDPFFAGLGRRCLLSSHGGDRSVVEGLDLELVDRVEDADFLLVGGIDGAAGAVAALDAQLATARARDLPFVCANPDIVGIAGDTLTTTPGALARRYAAMGGTVRTIGKPEPEIYALALAAIGEVARARIVAVGDSLQHDVAGGARIGVATAFVTAGIHRADFAGAASAAAVRARLARLCRIPESRPDWVMETFAWAAAGNPDSVRKH